MKHISALFIAALLFAGITSCEKVNKDDKKEGNTTEGNTQNGATANGGKTDEPGGEVNMALTSVQWSETDHNFGKINGKDSVAHVFKFKNTGTNPLKVLEVKPACGCTSGNYSKDEILPGAEGFVELKFSPVGKTGIQSKSATVIMNTDPKTHSLTFKADIK